MLNKLLDPRTQAVGRSVIGVSMLARPGLVPAALGVDRATRERLGWVVQMLAARDVALGLGALVARKERRLWLAAGVLADVVDALAVAAAIGKGQVKASTGAGLVALAAGGAAIGTHALRRG
ncbi:MAG: hypothetical protein JWM02_2498 [Frankiales bacterium]|nr:hypothetical protein [Frankiales bacterium]